MNAEDILKELLGSINEATRYKKEKGVDAPGGLTKLKKYVNNEWAGVHYSNINKVGINPYQTDKTTHQVGIFAWTMSPAMYNDMVKGGGEYATNRKFAHIIEVKPEARKDWVRIKEDGTSPNYTKERYEKDLQKIRDYLSSLQGDSNLKKKGQNDLEKYLNNFDDTVSKVIKSTINANISDSADMFADRLRDVKKGIEDNQFYFMNIYGITRDIATKFNQVGQYGSRTTKGKTTFSGKIFSWTKLLKNLLGIKGLIDEGAGLIHPAEHDQLVAFDKSSIRVLETIQQKGDTENKNDFDSFKQYGGNQHDPDEFNRERSTGLSTASPLEIKNTFVKEGRSFINLLQEISRDFASLDFKNIKALTDFSGKYLDTISLDKDSVFFTVFEQIKMSKRIKQANVASKKYSAKVYGIFFEKYITPVLNGDHSDKSLVEIISFIENQRGDSSLPLIKKIKSIENILEIYESELFDSFFEAKKYVENMDLNNPIQNIAEINSYLINKLNEFNLSGRSMQRAYYMAYLVALSSDSLQNSLQRIPMYLQTNANSDDMKPIIESFNAALNSFREITKTSQLTPSMADFVTNYWYPLIDSSGSEFEASIMSFFAVSKSLQNMMKSIKKGEPIQISETKRSHLDQMLELMTENYVDEILSDYKKNLPKRIVERKGKGDTVYTSKTAKEIMDLLPTFQLSENLGETGSADRQTYEKYFRNIIEAGSNAKERIDYIQRIASGGDEGTLELYEVLTSLTFVKLLSQIMTSFNPASAGFVFEAWMAALTLGEQLTERSSESGTLPIVDYYTGTGVPVSLKLLSPATSVEGSIENLLFFLAKDPVALANPEQGVVYEVAYKFNDNALTFFRFNLNYKNVFYRTNMFKFSKKSDKSASHVFDLVLLNQIVDRELGEDLLREAKEKDAFLEYKKFVKDAHMAYGVDASKLDPETDDISKKRSKTAKNSAYVSWINTPKNIDFALSEESMSAWDRLSKQHDLQDPKLSNDMLLKLSNEGNEQAVLALLKARRDTMVTYVKNLSLDNPLSWISASRATGSPEEVSEQELIKKLNMLAENKGMDVWYYALSKSKKDKGETQWSVSNKWVQSYAERTGNINLGEDWLALAVENYSQVLRELFVPVYTELANITGFINEYYLEGKVDSGLQAAESAKRFEKNTKTAMKMMNKQEG